jgi:hypothetical protein
MPTFSIPHGSKPAFSFPMLTPRSREIRWEPPKLSEARSPVLSFNLSTHMTNFWRLSNFPVFRWFSGRNSGYFPSDFKMSSIFGFSVTKYSNYDVKLDLFLFFDFPTLRGFPSFSKENDYHFRIQRKFPTLWKKNYQNSGGSHYTQDLPMLFRTTMLQQNFHSVNFILFVQLNNTIGLQHCTTLQ